jgi:drug/metabolite transporter (DMT)-like permease
MTSHRILVVKTSLLLILIVLFNSLGNVLLGKGMKQIGEVKEWSASSLGAVFVKTFTSGWIWLGIGCLLLFLVAYLVVLSWADFSYVLPATAMGYAVVPLLSHLFLREAVSSVRWTGVALICLGVALVGRTSPRTTGQG